MYSFPITPLIHARFQTLISHWNRFNEEKKCEFARTFFLKAPDWTVGSPIFCHIELALLPGTSGRDGHVVDDRICQLFLHRYRMCPR